MGRPVGEILWRPRPDRVAAACVTAFAAAATRRAGFAGGDHEALWAWSVARPESFWRLVWEECGLVGDGPGDIILADGDRMPGARWFPTARLNYAENLLQGPDADEVLVFREEGGRSARLARGQLRSLVAAAASALAAEGVRPGDRVAGYLPNVPETVVAMLGAASLGAVWTSCSPDFGRAGVLDRFGQVAPTVLVAGDGYRYGGKGHERLAAAADLRAALPSVRRLVVVPVLAARPALPDGAVAWDDWLRPHLGAPAAWSRQPFDHPLFIMYSSGTTGLPKCMVHSAGGTLLQHAKEHRLHCDLGPGDRFFYFTTCGWMMWNWLVSGLATGAAIMLYDGHPLQPVQTVWDYARDERFTVLGTSAKWLAACAKLGLCPRRTHGLAALRAVLSTGSPLLPETFDWVYEDVGADLQLSSISGGTDIISCFALGSPVLPVRRGELQTRGLGMAVEVRDESGRPLPAGRGELACARPFPSMPTGFWDDPDGRRYHQAYFARFDGIWCHGDFAELTDSGGLVIHGRSDTVLNPGGVRIGTAEIYRVVERAPEVAECVAVGVDVGGDQRIALFVVLRDGLVLSPELVARLKADLRREESPRHVPAWIVQAPAIPRTISGKIVEKAVALALAGLPVDNLDALADPTALEWFRRPGLLNT
ncbi:MAG: acetoacetate--CoA ligase [bacterium]|nr:acetoacetate--CoA ligase [bacterium]